MLLQLRVRFVISTKCMRTHLTWAGCHLHDVDVPPEKLPPAATPNASQVRSLPLPVEVGVLQETALSLVMPDGPAAAPLREVRRFTTNRNSSNSKGIAG